MPLSSITEGAIESLLFTSIAAKDVGSVSPAYSTAAYHPSRKQKYYWRSKIAKQAALSDQLTSSTPGSQGLSAVSGSWSVSGTSQWQYPTDVIVNTASDLLHLQQFFVGKVHSVCELYQLRDGPKKSMARALPG